MIRSAQGKERIHLLRCYSQIIILQFVRHAHAFSLYLPLSSPQLSVHAFLNFALPIDNIRLYFNRIFQQTSAVSGVQSKIQGA